MTWECQYNNCGHVTEYLVDMCEHYIKDHEDYPKNTPILCHELGGTQTKLFGVTT